MGVRRLVYFFSVKPFLTLKLANKVGHSSPDRCTKEVMGINQLERAKVCFTGGVARVELDHLLG